MQQVAKAPPLVAIGRVRDPLAQPSDRLAREQVRIPGIDRLELEVRLAAGQVQVVLATQLLAEALRPPSVAIEIEPQGLQR